MYDLQHIAAMADDDSATIHTFRTPTLGRSHVWTWISTATGGDYVIAPDGNVRTIYNERIAVGAYCLQIQDMYRWLLKDSAQKSVLLGTDPVDGVLYPKKR